MPSGWLSVAAAIDESLHGPLPGDLVDTQGHYLLKRPSTPIYSQEHDPEFAQQLSERLDSLVFRQHLRTHKYGKDVADEFPISHTPTDIKTSWQNEQDAYQKFFDELPPTPSDDGTPSSTMSGSTLASFKHQHTMSVSEKIELLGFNKQIDEPVSLPQMAPTSIRKLSQINNSFAHHDTATTTSTQNLFEQASMQSLQPRKNLKRRHSDAENDYTLDQEHQRKRRFIAPTLHRLISCG